MGLGQCRQELMYEVEMHMDAAKVILLNFSWFHHLLYFEEVRGVSLLFRISLLMLGIWSIALF